jgi:hypothetical protein
VARDPRPPDAVGRYLLLGLRLGRHIDGFVDAYYGPPELAAQVEREEPAAPEDLAAEAEELAGSLGGIDDDQRRRWLAAQLEGLAAVAERLSGRPMPYDEEVLRCYGVTLEPAGEAELEAVHQRLDELLPGAGPLAERYQSWQRRRELPASDLLRAFAAVTAELRGRTGERFGLPEGEHVDVELVSDEPWSAFNYYLGGRRSRVVINTDRPVRADTVADYAAHEIYPGHHTEHATKEQELVEERGRLEESILVVGTPRAVISEGIACTALAALGGKAEQACADVLAGLGFGYDVELVRAVREAVKPMRVRESLAHLIHVQGADLEEARAFALRWSLRAPEDVDKTLEFACHPTWRAYVVVYDAGERLVTAWANGDPARYRRLLAEQLTPADLVSSPA